MKTTVFEIKFKTVEKPIEVRSEECELPQELMRDESIVKDGWILVGKTGEGDKEKVRFRPLSEIEYCDVWSYDPEADKVEPDPEAQGEPFVATQDKDEHEDAGV